MRAYQTSRQSYAFWICNNSFMDFGAIGNGCDATVWTLLALWMFKNKSRRYCGLKAFSGHPITRIFWNHCFVWSTFKDDGILTHSLEVPQCIAQWIYYSKACHNNDYCIREISENNLNRKTVNIVKTSIRFNSFRFYLFGCLFSFSICFRIFHWLSMSVFFFVIQYDKPLSKSGFSEKNSLLFYLFFCP